MSQLKLTKRELRQRAAQLNDLLCEWDPIGVMGFGAPRDEYDCLIGPLLTMLQAGAATPDIASYLRKEMVEHFGLSPEYYDFPAAGEHIRTWFDRAWRDPAEPVTIYVALMGEGVDVWRPVQARPLSDDLFRIVGVEADVSDETWQFAAGAVVRCERRQLSDGQPELTAVEEVRAAS